MMHVNRFKALLALHGETAASLAKALGITPNTLSAKLLGHKGDFTRHEILAIKSRYNLTATDVDDIFFAEEVS